jgi:hypothetical protein
MRQQPQQSLTLQQFQTSLTPSTNMANLITELCHHQQQYIVVAPRSVASAIGSSGKGVHYPSLHLHNYCVASVLMYSLSIHNND